MTPHTCSVGDVYFHDGKPIGVVFFDDGTATKIVALSDINAEGEESSTTKLYWTSSSSSDYIDIPNVLTTEDATAATDDTDGKYNTKQIVEYSSANGYGYEAAGATQKYAPSACSSGTYCGKGEWYLPALGELWAIYNNLSTIQTAISKAGGTKIITSYYWSSTEFGSTYAWILVFDSGYRGTYFKYTDDYVRPVLAF